MKEQTFVFARSKVKPTKLTKAQIIEALQTFARLKKTRSFQTRAFDAWKERPISSGSIGKLFGTWSKAMREAGLKASKTQVKDVEDMVRLFKESWMELQSEPTAKHFKAFLDRVNAPYTLKSYVHYFGSLGRLAQRIVDHQDGRVSKHQLLARHERSEPRLAIPQKLRYEVIRRDGIQCVKCGASPKKDRSVTLEVDHIIPVAASGPTTLENLQTLCHECNQGKKHRPD